MSLYTRAATPTHPPFSGSLLCCSRVQSNPTTWANLTAFKNIPWLNAPQQSLQQISGSVSPFPTDQALCGSDTTQQNYSSDCGSDRDFTWRQQHQLPPCPRWERHQHLQLQGKTDWSLSREINRALLTRSGCRWALSYYTIKKEKPEELLLSAVPGSLEK